MHDALPALGELARCAQEYADAIAAYEEPDLSHLVVHARGNAMERAENAFQKRCTPYAILQLVALATGGAEATRELNETALLLQKVTAALNDALDDEKRALFHYEAGYTTGYSHGRRHAPQRSEESARAFIAPRAALTPERPADAR